MRFKELADAWIKEGIAARKRSIQDQIEQINWILKHVGNPEVEKINAAWVSVVRYTRLSTPTIHGKPIKPASVNRYMATLSAILNYGYRMELIDRVPHIPRIREENERRAWITPEQAKRLLKELPPHLEAMTAYTLQTGVRRANCTGLQWDHINMETKRVRVPGSQFKQGVVFSYPLNNEARAAIARAQHHHRHPQMVFHYKGQRISNPNDHAFKAAVIRAGLVYGNVHGLEEGQILRWHDLRHTWATWHVMAGTPVHVLKELGGWKSTNIVERYYHLSESFTSGYVENVSFRNMEALNQL